jgi:HEAT repeat protein
LKPKRVAFGVGLGLALVVGWVLVLREVVSTHERIFQGKSAAQWGTELAAGNTDESRRANLVLNTAIIPELLDAALRDTTDSAWKLGAADMLNRLPGVRVSYTTAPGRRGDALRELGKFGPAAKPAIPVLVQLLNDSDAAVRCAAAAALGEIHSDPDVSIPALTACMGDPDMNDEAAEALGKFGSLAKAAVPQILPLLHGDKAARHAARLALPEIDPEAAAQAGIKTRLAKQPSPPPH